jgi:hypothetical protein
MQSGCEERSHIPDFVSPRVRELISDCGEDDPDDGPMFEEIVETAGGSGIQSDTKSQFSESEDVCEEH